MQKEFAIQVFICIDKARYDVIRFFLLKEHQKIQQHKSIAWKTMNYNHEQNI